MEASIKPKKQTKLERYREIFERLGESTEGTSRALAERIDLLFGTRDPTDAQVFARLPKDQRDDLQVPCNKCQAVCAKSLENASLRWHALGSGLCCTCYDYRDDHSCDLCVTPETKRNNLIAGRLEKFERMVQDKVDLREEIGAVEGFVEGSVLHVKFYKRANFLTLEEARSDIKKRPEDHVGVESWQSTWGWRRPAGASGAIFLSSPLPVGQAKRAKAKGRLHKGKPARTKEDDSTTCERCNNSDCEQTEENMEENEEEAPLCCACVHDFELEAPDDLAKLNSCDSCVDAYDTRKQKKRKTK